MDLDQPKVFFATANSFWGGSEELWAQTALRLAKRGVTVTASIPVTCLHAPRIVELKNAGVTINTRRHRSRLSRGLRRLFYNTDKTNIVMDVERAIHLARPNLVVLSSGDILPSLGLMDLCREGGWPFVTIGHTNYPGWQPDANVAFRVREALLSALRCYFVADKNRSLVEARLDCKLPNAEIVRNPFNVSYCAAPAWPGIDANEELRLACVGRLDTESKGQDILLGALAHPTWRKRSWRLAVYGDGPARSELVQLVNKLGLHDRVMMENHVDSIEKVWGENHVLVLPSRYEGLPMVIVEAMLCARPVVATNVGGVKELIEDHVSGFIAAEPTVDSVRSALDQLWAKRSEVHEMGKTAAISIRKLVPVDPVGEFSNKLEALL